MQLTYIIQQSRRRSISVSVMTDNRILVKAPYGTSERTVQEFLLSKKDWIKKHLEKQNGEVEKAEELGLLSADEIKQIKKQARKIIPERVGYWAEKIGVSYGRIAIRLQSSRWGSCARNGNLNFNCLLVIMPEEIMDSVVVHELCHRKHMNHSKEFYAEIDRVFPDYKRCDKWLKDHGGVYMKRAATAARIKKCRIRAGYSVREIQNIFNFSSPEAVYAWEKGKYLPNGMASLDSDCEIL